MSERIEVTDTTEPSRGELLQKIRSLEHRLSEAEADILKVSLRNLARPVADPSETLALMAEHRLILMPYSDGSWLARKLAPTEAAHPDDHPEVDFPPYDKRAGFGPTIGDAVRECVKRIRRAESFVYVRPESDYPADFTPGRIPSVFATQPGRESFDYRFEVDEGSPMFRLAMLMLADREEHPILVEYGGTEPAPLTDAELRNGRLSLVFDLPCRPPNADPAGTRIVAGPRNIQF